MYDTRVALPRKGKWDPSGSQFYQCDEELMFLEKTVVRIHVAFNARLDLEARSSITCTTRVYCMFAISCVHALNFLASSCDLPFVDRNLLGRAHSSMIELGKELHRRVSPSLWRMSQVKIS